MHGWNRKLSLPALVIGSVICAGHEAKANSILVNFVNTAPSGGNTDFNYTADLTAVSQLVTGSFFTIYDFAGFVSASTVPPDWTVGTEFTSAIDPFGVTGYSDDPLLPNIVFTYSGVSPAPGPLPFLVTITSTYSGTTQDSYVGRDQNTSGVNQTNFGSTTVAAVPLPPAIAGGLGLMSIWGIKGLRRQRLLAAME